jgi:hypothetical protein
MVRHFPTPMMRNFGIFFMRKYVHIKLYVTCFQTDNNYRYLFCTGARPTLPNTARTFKTTLPITAGELFAGVSAQVLPNGRISDGYRVTLGESKIVNIKAEMSAMGLAPASTTWFFRHQIEAKDIQLRSNMTSGEWFDAHKLIEDKVAWVEDGKGHRVKEEEVLQMLSGRAAAIRFAVVLSEDARLELNLQTLPAAAEVLIREPGFKRSAKITYVRYC